MSLSRIVFLLIVLAIGLALRQFAGPGEPAQADVAAMPEGRGTVVVYGRDGCSYTQSTLAALRADGIPTTYLDLDDPDIDAAFQDKFDGSGLVTERGYPLPIVEIDGHASARPDPASIAMDFWISQKIAQQGSRSD
jgi:hypothetical protein